MSANSRCPACRILPTGSCDRCKESKRLSQQRRRDRLKASGCCTVCGEVAVTSRCEVCREKQKDVRVELPCQSCGAERGTKRFVSRRNLCVDCRNSAVRRQMSTRPKGSWAVRRHRYAERNFRNWFTVALVACRNSKRSKRRKIECTLTVEFLLGLLESQKGRCALTGLMLTHRQKDMYSASIDRIETTGHYTPGNVQLTCRAINFMKNDKSNQEAISFLESIRSSSG